MSVKFKVKKSSEHLANPWAGVPFYKRMVGSVKLVDNHEIIDHGNGYISVVPIDETILWTEEDAKKYFGE